MNQYMFILRVVYFSYLLRSRFIFLTMAKATVVYVLKAFTCLLLVLYMTLFFHNVYIVPSYSVGII